MTTRSTPAVRRMSEATERFVPYNRPPTGAPNVAVIVLDDIGFAQLGCFGSAIATPNVDRLASNGLRYNRFHVTSICSSTRAALLSGRNHHAVGMGMTMETPMGFPGYTGRIPQVGGTAAAHPAGHRLQHHGRGQVAPLPRGGILGLGPYGPLAARPGLRALLRLLGRRDQPVGPAAVPGQHVRRSTPHPGRGLPPDRGPGRPGHPDGARPAAGHPGQAVLLLPGHLAPPTRPHQVPARVESSRIEGQFDQGWEAVAGRPSSTRQLAEGIVPPGTVLTERPSWVPDWDDLSADERRLFARYMEVFAGFVTHADAQIGRFIDFLAERGVLDNTLVLVLSDNGASAEGSQIGTVNEPNAWLGAGRRGRCGPCAHRRARWASRLQPLPVGLGVGGQHPPAAVEALRLARWGAHAAASCTGPGTTEGAGDVRPQFCHAVDLFSTVLDAAGIEPPAVVDGVTQQPIDGASIVDTIDRPVRSEPAPHPVLRDARFPSDLPRRLEGHDGLHIAAVRRTASLVGSHDFDDDHWALFDLDEDFSEAHDLSAEEPDRARALQELWWAEAGRNQVLPMWEGGQSGAGIHPGEYPPPEAAIYIPGGGGICEAQLPPMMGGFTATAEIDVPSGGGAEGMICALGDLNDGWAFYLLDGRPVTCLLSFGHATRIAAAEPVPAGAHNVSVRFRPGVPDEPNLSLLVDDVVVASADHPAPAIFVALSTAGARMVVGQDRGLPFNDDYQPPFPFSATLRRLVMRSEHPGAHRIPSEVVDTASHAD